MRLERESEMLKAIAHPIRLEVILLLQKGGKKTVTELFEELSLAQAVVSQHLRILKDRDVVDCERVGKNRMYFLKHEKLAEVVQRISGCCQNN